MTSESIKELATALVAVQAEMPKLTKNANNPFFKSKYVDLATVMASTLPILSKHGLAITQFVSNIDGQSALTTTLLHKSGEYMSSTMPLLLPKNDPQGQGSAITYARRYGAMAALGIVADEDDDGNRATQTFQSYGHPKPPTRQERLDATTPLMEAKGELVKAFHEQGISNFKEMESVIESVIGKRKADSIDEVEQIIEHLNKVTA